MNKFYASSKELTFPKFIEFARANEFSRADCYKTVKIKLHDPKSTQQTLDFIHSQVRDQEDEREKAANLQAAPAELQEILKGHLSLPLDSFKKGLNDINTPSKAHISNQTKNISQLPNDHKIYGRELEAHFQHHSARLYKLNTGNLVGKLAVIASSLQASSWVRLKWHSLFL